MPKEIKGHADCPECHAHQPVQFDGKKYFISCTDCRTFTSYQSKEAKARIQNRLVPIIEPEPKPEEQSEEQPEPVQGTPEIKTNAQPFQPVRTPSFLESLSEFL